MADAFKVAIVLTRYVCVFQGFLATWWVGVEHYLSRRSFSQPKSGGLAMAGTRRHKHAVCITARGWFKEALDEATLDLGIRELAYHTNPGPALQGRVIAKQVVREHILDHGASYSRGTKAYVRD